MNPDQEAVLNLVALNRNTYPGRGIVVGLQPDGKHMVQVYWIMGRSTGSRNRVLVQNDGNSVRTQAVEPVLGTDPVQYRVVETDGLGLIIYQAMAEYRAINVVSNGDQTDTVIRGLQRGKDPGRALKTRNHEPDEPNYTPRITAVSWFAKGIMGTRPLTEMFIIRKSLFGSWSDRQCFRYEKFGPGLGFCLTTYQENGKPLPPFRGEPYLLPIPDGVAKQVAEEMWGALNKDNRVALVVKLFTLNPDDTRIHIINKHALATA
ncbi:MAG: IMP cyclohydrolase [bacterium]|nr:IMP cyclohydrolase [bacterium]